MVRNNMKITVSVVDKSSLLHMDYARAKAKAAELDALYLKYSAALAKYPKGAMGITSDDVKASKQYRADKLKFDQAFQDLRNFNTRYVKKYAKEIRADRAAKYRAKT